MSGLPPLTDEEKRALVEAHDRAKAKKHKGERGLRKRESERQSDLGKPVRSDDWDIFTGEPKLP